MTDKKALLFGEHYIHLELNGIGGGTIESNLKDEEAGATDDPDAIAYNLLVDALEAVVLAHACAGVDINDPKYVAGVSQAVDVFKNRAT